MLGAIFPQDTEKSSNSSILFLCHALEDGSSSAGIDDTFSYYFN